ncbi:zinc-binding dehydrogenase [Kocuria rhizophila]|nr:zinc-binding dehydrogenase [Kocuria rhizophila]
MSPTGPRGGQDRADPRGLRWRGEHGRADRQGLRRAVMSTASPDHDYVRELGAEPVEYGTPRERVKELAPTGGHRRRLRRPAWWTPWPCSRTAASTARRGPRGGEARRALVWVSPDAERPRELARLADDGKLTVRVDRTFPLAQLPDASRPPGGSRRGQDRTHGRLIRAMLPGAAPTSAARPRGFAAQAGAAQLRPHDDDASSRVDRDEAWSMCGAVRRRPELRGRGGTGARRRISAAPCAGRRPCG